MNFAVQHVIINILEIKILAPVYISIVASINNHWFAITC